MSTWGDRLQDLVDVDPTGLTDGHVAVWNAASGKWVMGAAPTPHNALVPSGIAYQNMNRMVAPAVQTLGYTSAVPRLTAIWLPAGFPVNTISMMSGSTALTTSGTNPHFWMALYDSSRNALRQSNDDTAATWPATTVKTVSLSSQFTTTYTGLHYIALLCNRGSTGTLNTLTGLNAGPATTLNGLAASLSGNTSDTLVGATAPSPAGTITPSASTPWCGVA